MSYTWEKFHAAIETLTGPGTIKERLGDAFLYSLLMLKPEDLPEHLQSDFQQLCDDLSRVQASGDEGNIKATVKVMSDDEASTHVKKIVSMYDKIARGESN